MDRLDLSRTFLFVDLLGVDPRLHSRSGLADLSELVAQPGQTLEVLA